MYGGLKSYIGYKPFTRRNILSRGYRYSPFYNLQGGINTAEPSHQIKDNELSDAYNCEYSTWGLKTRAGKTEYNSSELTSATKVRGIHASYATGSRFILAATDQGKVYKDDGSGTFSELQSGLTDAPFWFHDWKSYTFWCNETDALYRYDGANIDTVSDAPTELAGVVSAEYRLFGWKLTDNYLYFCDLNDETTWDPTTEYSGFMTVPQVKGDFPVCVVKQGRTLIVFKNNSIWRFYITGLPRNWTRELISESLGCAGKYAVDVFQDVIFFMGSDGRIYQLTNSIKLVSGKIDSPDTARWGLPTDLNMSKKSESVVKFIPEKRLLKVIYNDVSATTDYPNLYADYYFTEDKWLRGDLSAQCITVLDGKDDTGYIYIGDPSSGYIYQIDSGTDDDGTAIDAYFRTKDYSFGVVDISKIINSLYVSSRPVGSWNVIASEYIDFVSTGTNHNISQVGGSAVWDTAVWDTDVWGGEGLIRSRIDVGNNKAYYVAYKFRNATLDQYFEIRGLGIKYQLEPIL